MKLLLTGVLVTGLMGVAANAQPTMNIETAYPKGSIGYEALVKGDNARAVSQILASAQVSRHDPAKLLNLGHAYARMGRMAEASALFNIVMQSRSGARRRTRNEFKRGCTQSICPFATAACHALISLHALWANVLIHYL